MPCLPSRRHYIDRCINGKRQKVEYTVICSCSFTQFFIHSNFLSCFYLSLERHFSRFFSEEVGTSVHRIFLSAHFVFLEILNLVKLFQEMSNFDLGSTEPLAIQIFK